MSNQFPISETGFTDLEAGVEMFKLFRINSANMKVPGNAEALVEISSFVNDHPEGLRLVKMMAAKQPLPPDQLLGRAVEFVGLQKQRVAQAIELEKLDQELKMFL